MSVALITGASRGLGYEIAQALHREGWQLIVDARDEQALHAAADRWGTEITVIPGSVGDPVHIADLAAAVGRLGRLDLLVNNASVLGPSPQPALADYPLDVLREVFEINAFAPLALTQSVLLPLRSSAGTVLNVSSDAAVEAYEGWGGYGAAKAALDHATRIWAAEEPSVRFLSFDPGDMRTALHQQAFPGEDISDRPEPSTVVPGLLALLFSALPSGRYRAGQLLLDPVLDFIAGGAW